MKTQEIKIKRRRRRKSKFSYSKLFRIIGYILAIMFAAYLLFTGGRLYQFTVDSPSYIGGQ